MARCPARTQGGNRDRSPLHVRPTTAQARAHRARPALDAPRPLGTRRDRDGRALRVGLDRDVRPGGHGLGFDRRRPRVPGRPERDPAVAAGRLRRVLERRDRDDGGGRIVHLRADAAEHGPLRRDDRGECVVPRLDHQPGARSRSREGGRRDRRRPHGRPLVRRCLDVGRPGAARPGRRAAAPDAAGVDADRTAHARHGVAGAGVSLLHVRRRRRGAAPRAVGGAGRPQRDGHIPGPCLRGLQATVDARDRPRDRDASGLGRRG